MEDLRRGEVRELARLTARLSVAQQTFFQAEYGRHRRNPATALLLCLLLGAFGAQYFYFGRLRAGVVRLLLCWTLVPLVTSLFEARSIALRAVRYNASLANELLLAVEHAVDEQPDGVQRVIGALAHESLGSSVGPAALGAPSFASATHEAPHLAVWADQDVVDRDVNELRHTLTELAANAAIADQLTPQVADRAEHHVTVDERADIPSVNAAEEETAAATSEPKRSSFLSDPDSAHGNGHSANGHHAFDGDDSAWTRLATASAPTEHEAPAASGWPVARDPDDPRRLVMGSRFASPAPRVDIPAQWDNGAETPRVLDGREDLARVAGAEESMDSPESAVLALPLDEDAPHDEEPAAARQSTSGEPVFMYSFGTTAAPRRDPVRMGPLPGNSPSVRDDLELATLGSALAAGLADLFRERPPRPRTIPLSQPLPELRAPAHQHSVEPPSPSTAAPGAHDRQDRFEEQLCAGAALPQPEFTPAVEASELWTPAPARANENDTLANASRVVEGPEGEDATPPEAGLDVHQDGSDGSDGHEAVQTSLTSEPAVTYMTTPSQNLRRKVVQRVIVRKMAVVDGHVVAESTVERHVPVLEDAEAMAATVQAATDDAAREALTNLMKQAPQEALPAIRMQLYALDSAAAVQHLRASSM